MSEFKRELRYYVLKRTDIAAALSLKEQRQLERLCDLITDSRKFRGKEPLECVVVESDWPEYEPTWAVIQRRVENDPCLNCEHLHVPCGRFKCPGGISGRKGE